LWLTISGLCAIVASLPLLRSSDERVMRHAPAVLASVVAGFGLYVDEGVCADCHPAQAESYPQTGHARTLRTAAEWQLAAALAGRTFPDPERGTKYHYHFAPQAGLSVTIPERLGKNSFPLVYAFGSGTRRMTFVTPIPSRSGETVAIEHRVSVRSGQDDLVLELTPGQQGLAPQQDVEQFGRLVDAAALVRCLECHATRGEIRGPGTPGLTPNVGCQKCHWPGREHVMAMRIAQARGVALEPRAKPTGLEQIRACCRCHLPSGADDELKSMPGHIRNVRVQAAELLQSRCFTQSEDRLGCATCHDPHAPVAGDPALYVERCLACHTAPDSVSCPVSPTMDCIRCHMPPVTAENGLSWHDHRIRKK
jgi:hypothetical protein